MYKSESEISEIIRLKAPNALIDESIAARQLKVIHKAFNHLCHPDNKFIYIGDEVGLGKTYIAIGIASLLRKYAQQLFHTVLTKNYYQDVVIVPKKHLQGKWEDDYRSFIHNNYLPEDEWVKGVDNKPIAEIQTHEHIDLFKDTRASFHLYRMTSFSIARPSTDGLDRWIEKLRERLTAEVNNKNRFVLDIFDKSVIAFDLNSTNEEEENFDKFKRIYAWLLNICMPQIECLIVDEAHNFKHGIEQEHVALRNKLAARYFGAIDIEKDQDLLALFPELRKHVRPRVEKLICLSATPINNSLEEIPNQIDCFLPLHQLVKKNGIEKTLHERNEAFIKENINAFMIRGLMELKLGEQKYSRNQYRAEHRNGNVLKADDSPLRLDNNLDGLIMGLVQYKVIQEIGTSSQNKKGKRGVKNNKSFEIGMLASYESFNQSKVSKEYEDTHENKDGSLDKNVLEKIVASYKNTFQKLLPHPKQDRLVETLFEYTKRQEKALVFVRRIGSVIELEQRLLDRYEDFLMQKIAIVQRKYRSETKGIKELLKRFEQKDFEKEKSIIFGKIGEYLISKGVHVAPAIKTFKVNELITYFRFIFGEDEGFEQLIIKTIQRNHPFLSKKIKKAARKLAEKYLSIWQTVSADTDDFNENRDKSRTRREEEDQKFFFINYFGKGQQTLGFRYRQKTYRSLWFEMNYKLFNDTFQVFEIEEALYSTLIRFTKKENEKKRQVFNSLQDIYQSNVKVGNFTPLDQSKLTDFEFFKELEEPTFLTQIFTDYCYEEVKKWVDSNRDSSNFFSDLTNLAIIIKQLFNHGSGLLPAYLADCYDEGFEEKLHYFITQPELFGFVLEEIRKVINDYDTIIKRNLGNYEDKKINKILENLSPIVGTSGEHKVDRSRLATQFKMPGYPYILITTDIMKEGVDLHSYCQDVFHYGIAWNPTDMEQRTGRVDRIGSLSSRKIKAEKEINLDTKVHVFYPYLSDTLEVNQVKRVFEGMDRFIETFYNDLSVQNVEQKYASTDEVVYKMPPQKNNKLTSKFDYDKFLLDKTPHLNLKEALAWSLTEKEMANRLKEVETELNQHFSFYRNIHLNYEKHQLTGSIDLVARNHRRGPFMVKIITHPEDSFRPALKLSSFVCKTDDDETEFAIAEKLKEQDYHCEYDHEWLLGYQVFDWDIPDVAIAKELHQLVVLVDDIEKAYFNSDVVVFV